MTPRIFALIVAGVLVVGQFLASQTLVPLPPAGQLAVASATVLGTFALLHLPAVSSYVIGGDPPAPAP